jgi:predicted nucleotidyltransferase
MRAFITGSHAYGRPTEKSDVDLVILVSKKTANALRSLCELDRGPACRFGDLNLILCTTEVEFAVWELGTQRLKMETEESRPIDKHEAKEKFNELRRLVGIEDEGDSR